MADEEQRRRSADVELALLAQEVTNLAVTIGKVDHGAEARDSKIEQKLDRLMEKADGWASFPLIYAADKVEHDRRVQVLEEFMKEKAATKEDINPLVKFKDWLLYGVAGIVLVAVVGAVAVARP